jgi:hypothetical protein
MADNHISIAGSKGNWAAINSESFLGGPQPGKDQVLINSGNQTVKVAAGQSLNEIQKMSRTHVHDEDEVDQRDQGRQLTITKDDKLTVKGSRTVNVDQHISEISKKNIHIAAVAGQPTPLKGPPAGQIYLEAGVELTLQGPGGTIKIDKTGVTIQGVLVKIN